MLTTEAESRFAGFAEECVGFTESLVAELALELDPYEEAERGAQIIESITRKWTVPIIYFLYRTGPLGFSELARVLGGISSRTLSQRLKALEARGWVQRTVTEARPPRVLYALTGKGTLVAKLAGPMYLYIRLAEG